MLGLIRSYPHRTETQRRPVVDSCELSALTSSHDVLLRASKGVTRTREKGGYSKRIKEILVVKYQRWAGQVIPVPFSRPSEPSFSSQIQHGLGTCHNASFNQPETAL